MFTAVETEADRWWVIDYDNPNEPFAVCNTKEKAWRCAAALNQFGEPEEPCKSAD